MVLYLYTDMLDCIHFTHYRYVCNHYSTSGQFTAVAKDARVGRAVLPRGVSIQKKCVYISLIDLLNDNHTQNGLIAVFKML